MKWRTAELVVKYVPAPLAELLRPLPWRQRLRNFWSYW